jgi:hypothetical protein
LKRKNQTEIEPDSTTEKHKKRLRPLGRQYCRIGVGLLLSTKRPGGWGIWLKDAGRGLRAEHAIAEIAVIADIADIARDRKTKNFYHRTLTQRTRRNTKEIAVVARHRRDWELLSPDPSKQFVRSQARGMFIDCRRDHQLVGAGLINKALKATADGFRRSHKRAGEHAGCLQFLQGRPVGLNVIAGCEGQWIVP